MKQKCNHVIFSDNLCKSAAVAKRYTQVRMDEEELNAKVKAFKSANPPDAKARLEWLRPTILGFYLDGYTKRRTFEFLSSEGLVSCSLLGFYRWIAKHMDLEAEARAHLAAMAGGSSDRETTAKPVRQNDTTAKQGDGSPGTREISVDTGFKKPTLSTTQQTPVKSTHDKAKPDDEERRRMVKLADEALADMERNSLGATSDRVLARLKQRDKDSGERDG
ncbi:hypothetical protein [Variovorax ginsengisoli]|uniref:Uncharacterized protein n=1 Tax=Variovorax ginsengisoli TaxID=363844 RepID=A0ABT9SDZ2_9BURK|nr:hypothetical protein [Variovorax ginsengisoli]MDP9902420.1 hypothetical protein [Variovorax ginsengisoli]